MVKVIDGRLCKRTVGLFSKNEISLGNAESFASAKCAPQVIGYKLRCHQRSMTNFRINGLKIRFLVAWNVAGVDQKASRETQ